MKTFHYNKISFYLLIVLVWSSSMIFGAFKENQLYGGLAHPDVIADILAEFPQGISVQDAMRNIMLGYFHGEKVLINPYSNNLHYLIRKPHEANKYLDKRNKEKVASKENKIQDIKITTAKTKKAAAKIAEED